MTKETDELAKQIRSIQKGEKNASKPGALQSGYNITINLLTDLFGCIVVGLGLGLIVYKYSNSVLLLGAFTILGGIAGLWTTIRYALKLQKKENKK